MNIYIDRERARRLAWLAVAIYLVGLSVAAVLRTQGDFNIYYRAGTRVLAGEPIYRLDESSHFLYAPVFAIMFAPFAILPLRLAQGLWFLFSAAGLIGLIRASGKLFFGARQLPAEVIVIPVLLSARFINNNIEHGQANLPVMALAVWGVVLADEGRAALSGLALAAAILVKPYAALPALFLILERRRRALVCVLGFALLLMALPVLVLGFDRFGQQTLAYLAVVASMTGRYTLMLTNQSASSAFARWVSAGGHATTGAINAALSLGLTFDALLLTMIVIWFLREGDRNFVLAAMFCLMPSIVPVSWKSYYVAMLPAYMMLTAALWTDRSKERPLPMLALAMVALSVALNLISGARMNHLALYYSAHFLSSLTLLGAVALTARWARGAARVGLVASPISSRQVNPQVISR